MKNKIVLLYNKTLGQLDPTSRWGVIIITFLCLSTFIIGFFNHKDPNNLDDTTTTQSSTIPYNGETNTKIYGIKGEDILIREGPGKQYPKIVNQKATDILKELEYIQVDNSCKVLVEETKDGWSKIRVVEPDWLNETHIGWIKSEFVIDPSIVESDPLQGKTLTDWKSIQVPTYMNDKQEIYTYLVAMTKEQNYLDMMANNPVYSKKVKVQQGLFTKKLQRDFPKLRKAWIDMMHRTGWENDITFFPSGSGNKICNVTGYMFASNSMIKTFYEGLGETFQILRFNQVRFKWYDDSDEYTYYKCGGKKDGERLDNYGLTNYQ
jgi:hypothetical protein